MGLLTRIRIGTIAVSLLTCAGEAAARPTGTPAQKKASAVKKAPAKKATAAGKTKGAAGKKIPSPKLTAAQLKAKSAVSEKIVKLNSAFVASATLRPMAQQLASTRSVTAYGAVTGYAAGHPGTAAATAYLALGHAYALDHRYGDAFNEFSKASAGGNALSDYADYLGAQALVNAGRTAEVFPLLDQFAVRHPDSIFDASAPLLEANAYIQQKNGLGAVKVLEPLLGTPVADRADFQLALGRGYQLSSDQTKAAVQFRVVFRNLPLSNEAIQSLAQLQAMGMGPSAGERKVRADALFNAKHYSEAEAEYRAIKSDSSMSQADRDALQIYSAVCDLKLKHLGRREAENLPSTADDSAALKLYLLAEISRTEKDRVGHDALIAQMVQKFPQSRWTEEALYSGGNMYLLTHDAEQAIYHYKLLVDHFPASIYAPSAHWRVAWMDYRLRRFTDSAPLMDEQITRYGAGIEASSALYWRGRIYEDQDRNFGQAANYYRSIVANYPNYYYGYLAKERLKMLGAQPAVAAAAPLASVRKLVIPDLASVVPQDDPHLIKAKLLANAALNEYIGQEIAAGQGSQQWGALAQAQIYASFGEITRSLQSMKKSGISFFALPTNQVPNEYWRLIFPQPFWGDLVSDSQKNGLDPYLVASLIRQESEFNPGAVSPAHAYGLMQLLPSVGKENARREGMKGFQTASLLNPATNLQLGTRNLKQVLDRFGGQPEYALAAYNAGDVPVRQWMASGEFKDIPEWVESIPYTETRDYVQAIMRNRELYRALYAPK